MTDEDQSIDQHSTRHNAQASTLAGLLFPLAGFALFVDVGFAAALDATFFDALAGEGVFLADTAEALLVVLAGAAGLADPRTD